MKNHKLKGIKSKLTVNGMIPKMLFLLIIPAFLVSMNGIGKTETENISELSVNTTNTPLVGGNFLPCLSGSVSEIQNGGTYRIRVISSTKYLHVDGWGDKLVSTRYQETDDFTRFIFEKQADGSYRIKVKADGLYLHVDGWGDKLVSTRYQETDDFTRFILERHSDGAFRIKVKGDNRYLHLDLTKDQLLSTRYDGGYYIGFYLVPENRITLQNLEYKGYLYEGQDNQVSTIKNPADWRFIYLRTSKSGNPIGLIRNINSGRNLDYDRGTDEVDTSVNADPDQQWEVIRVSGNNYLIKNVETGIHLDSDGASQYANVDGSNNRDLDQQWIITCR